MDTITQFGRFEDGAAAGRALLQLFKELGTDIAELEEPTSDELFAKLTISETTWYRNLVQLHKAKGGQLFKVYAAGLAISLFIILLSGFLMAWQV